MTTESRALPQDAARPKCSRGYSRMADSAGKLFPWAAQVTRFRRLPPAAKTVFGRPEKHRKTKVEVQVFPPAPFSNPAREHSIVSQYRAKRPYATQVAYALHARPECLLQHRLTRRRQQPENLVSTREASTAH
jgi:hypothetical protein